jgi:hypothetical protein
MPEKGFFLFYRLNFIFYRLDIIFADTNMLFFSFLTVKAWVSTCSPNSKEDMCFPSHVMLNTIFRRTQILCQPLNFRKFVAASWRHLLVIMTNESKINKSMTLLGSMFRNLPLFNGHFRIRLIGGTDSIYKAYIIWPKFQGIFPQNMARNMVHLRTSMYSILFDSHWFRHVSPIRRLGKGLQCRDTWTRNPLFEQRDRPATFSFFFFPITW